jgi:hypothetical protein
MASHSLGPSGLHKEVRIEAPMSHCSSPSTAASTAVSAVGEKEKVGQDKKKGIEWNPQKWKWPPFLAWVPGQLNYQGFKPVIRSSFAVWIVFPVFVLALTTVSRFYFYFVRLQKKLLDKRPFCISSSDSFNRPSTQ